ncbi:GspH/FimT family pseudopilin [Solidesulfovibrio magneticus]|uniref:Type II secretion system protein H n=1 Tax=Solidesulfovibrio magneticus (strain ATCC 700980 / DSM 13731 / RS-1) TaxID=573370 RepID=C4XH36_SOLM1|nr:GspH/FimT family pseudopilin [Solidesulfovibrio magneticus]BAH76339.1 general secretion pathway protein H family protein [Solidesulfovibrio magneticus RS-1]
MAPRRAAGFTLVELTIVLVVMGIAAGLAIPQLAGLFSRESEKSLARQLAGLLTRARTEAIVTGRPFVVTLDWARGEARLKPLPESGSPVPAGRDGRKNAERSKAAVAKDAPGNLPDPSGASRPPVVVPPTKIADKARPGLLLTPQGRFRQPESLELVVTPQGLCQPVFARLAAAGGSEAAVVVDPVGCRVSLLTADLEAAQARFEKSLGLLDPPWSGVVRPADAP